MIGKSYNIPPQRWDADHTSWVPAGALRFGVEYRKVDPEALRAEYADDPARLADLEAQGPAGGFYAEGLSIHVSTDTGGDGDHEFLRFDLFDDPPHYHYNHPPRPSGDLVNNVVDFDVVANGPMLDWALHALRHRLPLMLTEAGGETIVPSLDDGLITKALDQIEEMSRAALAPPTDQ
jgi:hypothetical protein